MGHEFLLQALFVEPHDHNVMMHLLVENLDDWYADVRASGVIERFGVMWRVAHDLSA